MILIVYIVVEGRQLCQDFDKGLRNLAIYKIYLFLV